MKDILKKIPTRFYIFLSGLLLGFSIIFAEIGLLAYVALIPLALMIFKRAQGEKYKLKKAYLDGFIFYMAFDVVAFYWLIYFYPTLVAEDIGLSSAAAVGVIALGWIGLSALQSVFSALVFVIIAGLSKTEILKKHPIMLAPVAAALFAVNEWTQTFTWAGVPWARIGISQTEMPILMQSASLFGTYFLTFVIVLFNFLLARLILEPERRRKYALITASVMIIHVILGTVLYFIPTVDSERSIKIASVQGNFEAGVSSEEKYEEYMRLTKEAVSEGAELVIWPEGIFATDIHSGMKYNGTYRKISTVVSSLSSELGVTIVLGSFVDYEDKSNTSMSAFYPDGSSNINAYAKRRPVPFGEFLPLAELVYAVMPALAEINMFSNVTPGEKSTCFYATSDEASIKVGTLICFDSIYETLGIDSAREGAEIFIVPSNDSWFADSRALNMHHSQNILRAVEQGKYTVSCANTGISSVINGKGEVINDMPIYTAGYVIDTVYASSARTLYSYIGNLFVYLCIAGIIGIFAADIVCKKRYKF